MDKSAHRVSNLVSFSNLLPYLVPTGSAHQEREVTKTAKLTKSELSNTSIVGYASEVLDLGALGESTDEGVCCICLGSVASESRM